MAKAASAALEAEVEKLPVEQMRRLRYLADRMDLQEEVEEEEDEEGIGGGSGGLWKDELLLREVMADQRHGGQPLGPPPLWRSPRSTYDLR